MIIETTKSSVFAWIGSSTTKRSGPNPPKSFVDYFTEGLRGGRLGSNSIFVNACWSNYATQQRTDYKSLFRASDRVEVLIRGDQLIRRQHMSTQSLGEIALPPCDKLLGLHSLSPRNPSRSYNLARSGTSTKDWLKNSLPFQVIAAVRPDFIFIQLGGNDLRACASTREFGRNVRCIATKCGAVAPGATIVLVATAVNADIRGLASKWDEYMRELRTIATEDRRMRFADLRSVDSTPDNTDDDGIHMNERGARLQGLALLGNLTELS
jgi:lysophospholipase L1-like esterase